MDELIGKHWHHFQGKEVLDLLDGDFHITKIGHSSSVTAAAPTPEGEPHGPGGNGAIKKGDDESSPFHDAERPVAGRFVRKHAFAG